MYLTTAVDEQLCCFKIFALMSNAAMNILGRVFGAHLYAFFLNIYLGVELLGHKECTCSTAVYAAKQSSKAVELVYAPFSGL